MGFKRVTLRTYISIAVIMVSALLAGYLTATQQDLWYLLLLIPIPIASHAIMHTFNQSNRQIAFFFEAIRNEDSSLKFPTSLRQKSLRHLYKSLNELNEQINEIKMHNEYLEKYYQTFIQHAATGLMAINSDNEVEIMNDKAFEYAGIPSYTPLHLISMRNPDLLEVMTSIEPGKTISYKRITADMQINLLVRAKEIRYEGTTSKLISLQDIRHELDEKELDSWQKLIRVLTHEIMNSIAPIVSLSGTLRRFFVSGDVPVQPDKIDEEIIENAIQGLDTIEERGNGLLNFVTSYRKLTRIPQPEFDDININDWLAQISLLLQEQLRTDNISLDLKIDPKIKTITGDEKLLTQVILNIFNNAIEALREHTDKRSIQISVALSKQNRPIIRIFNNGPAIPEEIAEKMFVPFFTTKEEGSGIGLSLSKQILRLHKGSIHHETTGESTGFIITF